MSTNLVPYLRDGRTVRAFGAIVELNEVTRRIKIKPSRPNWRHIWITFEELESGKVKGERKARAAKPAEPQPRERKPKPAPVPEWKRLVDEGRTFADQHADDALMIQPRKLILAITAELERSQTLFTKV